MRTALSLREQNRNADSASAYADMAGDAAGKRSIIDGGMGKFRLNQAAPCHCFFFGFKAASGCDSESVCRHIRKVCYYILL